MWSFMEENQNQEINYCRTKSGQSDTHNVLVTKELLQTELYNVTSYIERLSFVLHDHEDLTHLPQVKIVYVELVNSLKEKFEEICNMESSTTTLEDKASQIVKELNDSLKFIDLYIKMQTGSSKLKNNGILLINTLFHGAFNLHQKVKAFSVLEVQPPRFTFASIEKNLNNILLYQISDQTIFENTSIHDATITLINERKTDFYDRHLKKGHFYLLNKNFNQAKESFLKAKNYQATAEIFTLLGHLASKENRLEEARDFCLKAIKLDPHFGAAYNDYGVYLLNEGKAQDSLKWFSLAKKSLHYQNRDFSYINSGRAYFSLGEYESALDEFTKALTMNPENQELNGMVEKIKMNLENKDLKDFLTKFNPAQRELELN